MSTYYELIDLDSANVVGFYDTRDDALATIRNAFKQYGLSGVEDLALSETADDDDEILLGEGAELPRLAMETVPARVNG